MGIKVIHCYGLSTENSNNKRAIINTTLIHPKNIPRFQIRRHGASHGPGQDHRGRVFPVRRAGDRPARPRHRVQLLQDLPSEPAGRQEKGTEGELTFDSQNRRGDERHQ